MAGALDLFTQASERQKQEAYSEAINIYLRIIKFFPWESEAKKARQQIDAILEIPQVNIKIANDVEETFRGLNFDVSKSKRVSVVDAQKKAEEDAAAWDQEYVNKRQEIAKKVSALMTTTGFSFEGYKIDKYLDIISGETVLGTGVFSELGAVFADMTGTSSGLFAGKLSAAKMTAFSALKENCVLRGGNAIIGVDFDYITFSNNMIGVVANGTAVCIKKKDASAEE